MPLSRRPQSLTECLRAATSFLEQADDDDASTSAEYLLAHVLGCGLQDLKLNRVAAPDLAHWQSYCELLERRAGGEPVAYLEGSRGFFGFEFAVGPGVLIPRPDSEVLVEVALADARSRSCAGAVLDLGTGSGALLLSFLAHAPGWRGVGVDQSDEALAFAQRNCRSLGLQDRTTLLQSDWLDQVPSQRFDVVLANPPYIEPGEELGPGVAEHEPHAALFTPEGQALLPYRKILEQVTDFSGSATSLFFEVGYGRAEQVSRLGETLGWKTKAIARDLGGVERVVQLQRSDSPTSPSAER